MRFAVLLTSLGGLCFAAGVARAAPPDPQALEYFEKRVRPVLVEKCQSCHGPKKQQGGLRLDSRAGLLKGGDNGPVVQPGQPEKSTLIHAVRQDGDLKMPPKGKLDAETVAALTGWVKMGAAWPEAVGRTAGPSTVAEVRKSHWSFRPVTRPDLPAIKDRA